MPATQTLELELKNNIFMLQLFNNEANEETQILLSIYSVNN